jgi:hypothetical protein
MNEVGLGFTFLRSILSGDSTLRSYAPGGVWRDAAKPGTPTPYVVIGLQAGTDLTTGNRVRIWTSGLFMVRLVGPASQDQALFNAAARVDELLTLNDIRAVTGGLIYTGYRESPLQYGELLSGELWNHVGGLYRLEIQSI